MAVNKVYVDEHFLKLDDNSNYFDLKQKVIKDTEPFYDGLFSDNDLVSKAFVDAEIAKLPKPETDVLKLDGSRAMTGNLKMGDHTITGIRSSSQDNAALTVGASKSLYLPISGIRGMQGNLNMGGQSIVNLRPFVEIDSAQPAQDNQVINFGYFHTQRGDLKRLINEVASESLSRTDNGDRMEVNLNMNNNKIYNLADPITGTDALNLNFGNRKYLKVDGTNQMKGNLDMDNKQIKNLADGAENGDAVNVTQLINMTTTVNTEISKVNTEISKVNTEISKVNTEISKVNTNLQKSISNLKKQINNQINNAIAEYGYVNYLICVFYLDNNEFNNGEKISTLSDKKIALPSYDAIQNTESRKPTADDDLNFSYMNYRAQQCLIVNYNLNGKNNLNVFIVFRILDSPGATLNGIFGNDNGGNDRYIAVRHN